jgi:hypothetical protein
MYAIVLKGVADTEMEEEIVGIVGFSDLFKELERLYFQHNLKSAYFFPKHSILIRLQTMQQTLCWFGFQGQQRITCYVQKLALTSSQSSQGHPRQQDPVSSVPNDQ